ncbi:hypothetical protein [Streptomyces graminilatus]|uniref:hypothetical protein n=1 Tax=Streptomyces graminilatus TaxID=1464070 RepID=UPI0006E2C0F3|nr:hypothetical protein [Streptomyces graminilatus]
MDTPESETRELAASWAEVPSLAGREFVGGWFSASPERNDAFDEVTYVNDNKHVLDAGHFPEGLMEGFYALALLDHLVNEVVYVDDPKWSGWNYGLDRVRFVTPLTVADRFRVRGTLREVTPRQDGYLVLLDCAYEVEGRDKPAMVAEWRVLWTLEN